ncbi:MAG: hypothetical protein K8R89_02090, partial [Anaerolineae bacterium]|nr:hypothetical protein [Anaerolineae bacterium]
MLTHAKVLGLTIAALLILTLAPGPATAGAPTHAAESLNRLSNGGAYFTDFSAPSVVQNSPTSLSISAIARVFPNLTGYETVAAQSPIYFDASDPDVLVLGNDYYEIGIAKTNGALTYILDKTTGEQVSAGSRYGCLWGGVFEAASQPNDYVGGCLYERDYPDREFTWEWRPVDNRLVLRYIANPEHYAEVNVWVDITLSTEHWFDMHLFLENKSGYTVERVLFPSDLMFHQADLQELLLPIMPGVVLKPGIFDLHEDYSHVVHYPGWPGVFADYQALDSTKGRLAVYTIHKLDEIISTWLGPIEDSEHPGSFYLYHTFYPGITDQDVWTSPTVRVQVGQPYPQTLAAYRTHNHFADFPALREKAGARYDQLVKS